MSAMEGINSQTEPVTNGTTNGSSSTSQDPAAASIEKRQISIAQISSDLPDPSHAEIRGIITLLWPYSSLTKSLALNLAESDVRLRSEKGQVKISFTGSLGRFVGTQGLGIDDQLVLSLEGADFVKTVPRDSRDVGWELRYASILRGRIIGRLDGEVVVDHEAQDEEAAPVVPGPVVAEVPSPPRSPPRNRVSAIQNDDGEWSSPAFIKRARLSYGSLMSHDFDNFIGEDGSIPGKGRKKARFEPRKSGTWRYQSESRSPSPEAEDTAMAEPELEKPKPVMTEMACQTDDLSYDEAAVQEYFRRSQAIGHEARQDGPPQHILQDEGVQTMFDGDEPEMFSPITVSGHQPSMTAFGNPPVPLFAQAQAELQGSTTPSGEPPIQLSTTPSEPLPEQYQALVSPLASRSTAPAVPMHQEGQWPTSMFESMGYRPASSLSRSMTSNSGLGQSQYEVFSPVQPTAAFQPQDREGEKHNSAALALEELSRIHQAQQVEDAVIEYSDPPATRLRGSLDEVAPALHPPGRLMYPELPQNTFLIPAQPQFGSRGQSPQVQSAQHSSRQSPVRYPAERYGRELPGTPENRQGSPAAVSSPNQRAGSQDVRSQSVESIDLSGNSEDEQGEAGEYSQDEVSGGEQVRPGEPFEETKRRLLEEGDEESDEGSDGEGEVEEENLTEIGIPSWCGQPSMIPMSKERVDDEYDSNDEGDIYEGGSEEEGDEEDDENMSGNVFGQRSLLLNPQAQQLRELNDPDAALDADADGDAEVYSESEVPASQEETYSDDEEGFQSQDENVVDPDLAAMPGSDEEQYYSEEEEEELEESELEHDEERYERYDGEGEDMGPAYGSSGSQSRAGSQPSLEPVVIDLLSSDDDEPAPPKATSKSSPSRSAKPVDSTQPEDNDDFDENEKLQVQADESMSEAEDFGKEDEPEIAEHKREIFKEDKEVQLEYQALGDRDHDSPMPLADKEVEEEIEEELEEELDAQADEFMSGGEVEDEGIENATEIAEHEREVYDEEVEEEFRSQEDRDNERDSSMSPAKEEAEEQSGYEDEDVTAEEIEQQRDVISMDGGWESKPAKSSPVKNPFKDIPKSSSAEDEALPLPEKVESIEPPTQEEGEDADVEDLGFEVPKENFDEAKPGEKHQVKPFDPAVLAAHDEDRPVPIGVIAGVDDEDISRAHELADETHGESLVEAALATDIEAQNAAEEAQLAMAAILADRDEDRPARPRLNARAEAAQLALEEKLDEEMDAELMESKDMELAEEARHDIEMAELVPPARFDDEMQPPMGGSELEEEIARDLEVVDEVEVEEEGVVKAGVEPGPTGDPEDADIDGDVVASDDSGLDAVLEVESGQEHEVGVEQVAVTSAVEPGPKGDLEDADMDGDVIASDQELERFSEAEADAQQQEDAQHTVKTVVEPGPRGDPEDADMDGDIVESGEGLDADDADTRMASSPVETVPAVVIDDNAEVVVASDVEQEDDEEDYNDPSSQLFEEMSYIEQVEHTQTLETVEETAMKDEEPQQTVGSQFIVSENTQESAWAAQQSQQTQETMEASVFSQVVQDATSFQTLPASQPEVQTSPKVEEAQVEESLETETVQPVTAAEESTQDTVLADKAQAIAEDVEVAPAKHTRSHDKPQLPPTTPAKRQAASKILHAEEQQLEPTVMEVDEHPASHTRSHDRHTEPTKVERSASPAAHIRSHDAAGHCIEDDESVSVEEDQSTKDASHDIEMSIEGEEHPASQTRSHDKRVEKLRESERSGSPAEHTRSHDVLAGHCVEDDESAKGLQGSARRKSSSRKGTEQPSEQNTPSKAEKPAVTAVVEIPVSSHVENVQETPAKRITRSRRGTQDSVKPASPLKTKKRALTPVVEVEVPASSIENGETESVEEEPASGPPKRVTRSRQGTEEPVVKRSPPKTRKSRRKSLTPVVEVPASNIENIHEESQPEPPKRTTRARKASNASIAKAATPPRTRRMSLRPQTSPDTTNMTERSGSLELQAIDEEDDELPDPGAEALLEYDDSPEKPRAKSSVTSAPAPARNTRARRNASPELESSGQPALETPIKTRARALRSQSQSQGSSALASSQLASGLAHEMPDQPRDPAAEAVLEATSPAAPMTPANKSNAGTPLGTLSSWQNLTPSAVAAQITKTLRTQLPAYTPLKNIKNHLKRKIDVLAVCVDTPVPAVKSKHTPHDYVLKFYVTEPGSIGTVKEVTAFHHFKKCLPDMRQGNVVLLRNFLVDGQNNGCLRSEKDSSWAVWRREREGPEMRSDVPLEFEGGEDEYAKQLKAWWEEKVSGESKEKMKMQAKKAGGKK